MKTLHAALALLTLSAPGLVRAQVVDPELFGDGKPPVYREEETDRRFLKTGIAQGLAAPPKDPACRRILATLLVAYSDALPYLHRKDQNFFVDPALLATLDRTASSAEFPARAYLAAMIRRTLIDRKVPEAWGATSELFRKELAAPIATPRMGLYESALPLIDSFGFTIPALLDRYAREVKLAPSLTVDVAEDRYRDKYMDRDVTWGGLILHDIAQEAPPEPPKGKHKKKDEPPPEPTKLATWAIVGFPVGKPQQVLPGVPGGGQVPQLQIRIRLADDQKADVEKFVRGSRVMVKGHLWDIATNMDFVEVRDGFLFADPEWEAWPGLAQPGDVRACPIAVNDLSLYGMRKGPARGGDAFTHDK
jgi:hypothetical protein